MLKRALIALSLSSLLACAATDDSQTCDEGKCDDKYDATINGLPAADYYNLLRYEVDQEEGWHHFATTYTEVALGNGTTGSTDLYLMGDGRYYLIYEEWKEVSSNNHTRIGEAEVLEGDWYVEGATLVIGDLATGEGQDVKNDRGELRPGAVLTFSNDIRNPGLKGKPVLMGRATSTAGLAKDLGKANNDICEEDLGEYCADQDCDPCQCGDGTCQKDAFESASTCPIDC